MTGRPLRKAIVVGGTGFLGVHVVEALLADGVEVLIADARTARPGTAADGVAAAIGPLADLPLEDLVREHVPDVVFQLAGSAFVPPSVRDPIADLERNVGPTLRVLQAVAAAARPPRVVYVSSAAVYGDRDRLPVEEDDPREPVSPYGVAKLAAEEYVRQFGRLRGVEGFSVRPFSIYGPWQRKLVVHDLLARILAGEDPLEVAAPAEVTRDYVFGPDAARALVTLARAAPGRGEAYNLASETGTSLADLVAALLRAAGSDAQVRFSGVLRPGDPVRWVGSGARARALGVELPTPLTDGLNRTAAWLRAHPA